MSTADHFAALHGLAAGLCQDIDVSLERGPAWAWSPTRRTLFVPDDALGRHGVDGCAGIVAHEVGHALLSRYADFTDWPGPEALHREALNALEDPRVEEWMGRRYPGARVWLDAVHGTTPDPFHWLPTIQLLLAFVREGAWFARGSAPPCSKVVYPEQVGAALEQTREARRAYVADFLPHPSLTDTPSDALVRHDRTCRPHLDDRTSAWPSSREEAWVRVLARRAFEVAVAAILPHVSAVFAGDVEKVAWELTGRPQVQNAARRALASGSGPEVSQIVRWALGQPRPEHARAPEEGPRAQAELLLLWILGVRPQSPSRGSSTASRSRLDPGRVPPPPASKEGSEIPANVPDPLQADVDECVRSLEGVLLPKQRLAKRSGYASGVSLDLRRAMGHMADPRRPIDFWERTRAPNRRSAAFLLLVDLSGSMRGKKIQAAIAAARLFSETLLRLRLPFSVMGFQDEVIECLPFGAPFDDDARKALADLRFEVEGRRPNGHNTPHYNDDGPCLREAAGRLLDRGEEDRVLLVLSDGRPEGRRSRSADLNRAVEELSSELALVGIGVGPGTNHVQDYYPNHLADVPLAELPRRIGGVIAAQLG